MKEFQYPDDENNPGGNVDFVTGPAMRLRTTCKGICTYRAKKVCDSQDPADKCPDNLCMYVGNLRKPAKSECDDCKEARERQESLDEDAEGTTGREEGGWQTC
ncbi:hypothetical protein AAE478_010548 [Parahypoxylon ruwenzoriense]